MDWMSRLLSGHAGMWDGSQIRSRKETLGVVFHGPYRHLHVGTYRVRLRLSGQARSGHDDHSVAVLEIISQRDYLAHRLITASDLARGEVGLDFDVATDQSVSPGFSVQMLLRTLEPVDLAISALSCERVSDLKSETATDERPLSVSEWLPLLWTGPDATRMKGQILHRSTKPTIVFHGPYWRLPKGRYEAVFKLEARPPWLVGKALLRGYAKTARSVLGALWRHARGLPTGTFRGRYPLCTFQAMARDTELASKILYVGSWRLTREVTIPFQVTASQSEDPGFGLDFRLLAHTQLPFGFKSVTVRKVGA